MGLIPEPARIEGLKAETSPDYLEGASWYTGNSEGNGFYFEFPPGTLADKKHITADMLAEGDNMIKFLIELSEGDRGRKSA